MFAIRLRNRSITGLLFLSLWLGGCQPSQDTGQPEPVPATLLATAKPDSVITLTEPVGFSTISKTGQGPKGSLVRWDNPYFFKAFTYNQNGQVTSTLKVETNGLRWAEVARYEGTYLSRSYSSVGYDDTQSNIQVSYFTNYRYNAAKQLQQTLHYSRIGETNAFRLAEIIQYEYDALGQLRLSQTFPAPKLGLFNIVRYWQNGDCVRTEMYRSPGVPEPHAMISQFTYAYNQQVNPLTPLNLQPALQPSRHYEIRSTNYAYTGASINKTYEGGTDYLYGYDAEGRLNSIQGRLNWTGTEWSGPDKFIYAP